MESKLKIHISFYIFIFFVVYFNGFSLFLSYFVALFIHEYSHYLVSKRYSKMTQTLYIYPYGMNINVNTDDRKYYEKILIYISGPLSNILMILITVVLWWCFPSIYFYTEYFVLANISLGFFNLIPIYPLDGGNIILECFKTYSSRKKVLKYMKVFAIIFCFLFLFLFIISCFSTMNFSCFCISIFLFSTLFTHDNFLHNEIENVVSCDKIKEYKIYIVKQSVMYCELKKFFDKSKYVQFYIVNDRNEIIKTMSQEDIEYLYHRKGEKTIKLNR